MKISHEWNQVAYNIGFKSYKDYLKGERWQSFVEGYKVSDMAQACLSCDYPVYILYHILAEKIGRELLTDVIPLCFKCYDKVYDFKKRNLKKRIDHALQEMNGWTEEKRKAKFLPYIRYWERYKLTKKAKFKDTRFHNDYYKITNDIVNFRNYFKAGYSISDLAKIYKVPDKYIIGYIAKYPEQVS